MKNNFLSLGIGILVFFDLYNLFPIKYIIIMEKYHRKKKRKRINFVV